MASSDIYQQQMSAFDNSLASNGANYGWWNNVTGDAQAQATNNLFNAQQAAMANQFSHDEAELNRNWNERMSSTAYQRAMADMKAAGINPLNMSGGIEPASASTSAMGQAHQGHASSMANGGFGQFLIGLIRTVASIATSGASNATKVQTAAMGADAKKEAAKLSFKGKERAALINANTKGSIANNQLWRKDLVKELNSLGSYMSYYQDSHKHNGYWDNNHYKEIFKKLQSNYDVLWERLRKHRYY